LIHVQPPFEFQTSACTGLLCAELDYKRKSPGSQRTAKNELAIDDNQVNSPWFYGGHHCGARGFVAGEQPAFALLYAGTPLPKAFIEATVFVQIDLNSTRYTPLLRVLFLPVSRPFPPPHILIDGA
jgi:hypothetical protein